MPRRQAIYAHPRPVSALRQLPQPLRADLSSQQCRSPRLDDDDESATRDPMALRTAARETRCCPGRFTAKAKTSGAHSRIPAASGQVAARVTGYDYAVTERAGGGAHAGVQRPAGQHAARALTKQARREPDPVSPREPDPVIGRAPGADGTQLPPGHPSSPTTTTAPASSPPPDLSAYELPIPGDPDYQPTPRTPPRKTTPATSAATTPTTTRLPLLASGFRLQESQA